MNMFVQLDSLVLLSENIPLFIIGNQSQHEVKFIYLMIHVVPFINLINIINVIGS